MEKPRLFIDIDGVLYANYGGEWQLRPYIVTLTKWAAKHFDIYWVSYNSRAKEIVKIAYSYGTVIEDWWPTKLDDRGYKVTDHEALQWHSKAKDSGKLQPIQHNGGLDGDWLLIEDTPPTLDQIEILESKNSLHKYLVIPDTGSDALLDLRFVLEEWLKTKKLMVPFDWAVRDAGIERDLSIDAEWKGYGKSGRVREEG